MALSLVWKIHVNHNNIRMFPFKHCKIINICGGCVLGPLSPKIYTIKSIPMKQHINSKDKLQVNPQKRGFFMNLSKKLKISEKM